MAKKSNWPNRPEVIGLLRACKETLDDDAPRLLLADWLEDHGEPDRAQFIRLQCRLPTLTFAMPDYQPVAKRLQSLWEKHAAEWQGAFPGRPGWAVFERGLLHLHLQPLNFWAGDRQALAGTESWAWVEHFTADYSWPGEGAERWSFLRSPAATDIASLSLEGSQLSSQDVGSLAASLKSLPLRALSLKKCKLTTETLTAFLTRKSFTALTELDLTLTGIESAAGPLLAAWPILGQLRVLNLGYNDDLTNKGVRALATSPHLTNLRRLTLSGCGVGDSGARALGGAALPNLTRLDLIHNGIKTKGVIALARSAALSNLTWLDLSVSDRQEGAGDAGVCAIAESPYLSNLSYLGLLENSVGDEAALALARSPYLTRLRTLQLCHNPIGEKGALALAEAPWLDGLALLDITANPISPRAAQALRQRLGGRVKLDEGLVPS